MVFSGALTLTDLNDFITPSQACIKPVEQTNAQPEEKELGAASTEILIDSTGTYFEVAANNQAHSSHAPSKKLTQAQISLNDCLACSGCITSAESVLITLQSHTEVLNFLDSNGELSSPNYKIPVISIAPQSLASLAASLSASPSETVVTSRQVLRRIQVFCKDILGFAYVFDTTFARHIALQEHVEEFLERKKKDASGIEGQLPMLASACPGWICYAEKAHAEMLPFIARTKSPQQVMGTLVKEWMATRWGKKPQEIYHVSVMPCYDKKLEASRQDFYNDVYSTRDVDCVVTTGELELMMREKAWDLSVPFVGEPSSHQSGENSVELPELVPHPGTSSGSYLHSIMHYLQSESVVPLIYSVKTIRNTDYEEHTLTDGAGQTVFKGAKCYGFRNLQNVVRKVGRERGVRTGVGAAGRLAGRSGGVMRREQKGGVDERGKDKNYDYVEVMACPGGCVNGGGQLKPKETKSLLDEENYERSWEDSGVSVDIIPSGRWGDKDWTRRVEEAYWKGLPESNDKLPTAPDTPPAHGDNDSKAKNWTDVADHVVKQVMVDLCRHDEGKWVERRRELFRTEYRAVESEVVGLAVKW